MTTEDILAKLHGVRRSGDGWSARCPAHDDHHGSLSVGAGDDGRVLLHCHAGCMLDAICQDLGIETSDLFPGRTGRGDASSSSTPLAHSNGVGLTLAHYAQAKGLPQEFLGQLGITEISYLGRPAVRLPYHTTDGAVRAVQFRTSISGQDRFHWRKGDKPVPYGLARLAAAREAGAVAIVEGPSDAQTLWFHDIPALGIPGATSWKPEWDEYLKEIETVNVVIEPDAGGQAVERWLARASFRDRVRLVRLEGAKDPSDLYVQDRESFRSRWHSAVAQATPWKRAVELRNQDAAHEHYEAAKELLHAPDLIARIGEAIRAGGYAGNLTPPLLAYMAITSRVTRRPMNLAFVAQSSAGKNRAVDAAVELMPDEAVHVVRAGSPLALVYSDEVFEHRTVIFTEADSIPEDGPAASAVRSIASDNAMVYEVVERRPSSGRCETRRIEKPGPTGLITTSTKSLRAQMSTRVLEVPIPDDPDQTREVMRAHARRAQPTVTRTPDRTALVAIQRYLAATGPHDVAVTCAESLAQMIPASAIRMRRDFAQLLGCIQAVTVLHVSQRSRTPEGWIEATLDDYRIARDLLAPIFDAVAQESLTPTVRDTVEAVGYAEEIPLGELAKRLGLAKSTVAWRTKRAIRGGWLLNGEHRRGHPARLRRGTPLPELVSVLPTVEAVKQAVFECSSTYAANDQPPLCRIWFPRGWSERADAPNDT